MTSTHNYSEKVEDIRSDLGKLFDKSSFLIDTSKDYIEEITEMPKSGDNSPTSLISYLESLNQNLLFLNNSFGRGDCFDYSAVASAKYKVDEILNELYNLQKEQELPSEENKKIFSPTEKNPTIFVPVSSRCSGYPYPSKDT